MALILRSCLIKRRESLGFQIPTQRNYFTAIQISKRQPSFWVIQSVFATCKEDSFFFWGSTISFYFRQYSPDLCDLTLLIINMHHFMNDKYQTLYREFITQ